MPDLTRRRYPERPDCWHIYFGDVQIGTAARRVGQPHGEDSVGFYPGAHPGDTTNGVAATFEDAREEFEEAWRDARDWTSRNTNAANGCGSEAGAQYEKGKCVE
jgi:hypothetical protein